MFKSIVVGSDGSSTSREAVRRATELATLCGAQLHLVSAFKLPSQALMGAPAPEAMVSVPAISDDEVRTHVQDWVDELAKEIEGGGVTVATYVVAQNASQALLDVS